MTPPALTLENLPDPREKRYFTILLVISILAWLAVAVTCVGIFYVVLIGFFVWLAAGLFVARLRSEGVEVTGRQMPELHNALLEVCEKLQLKKVPRLYVMQAGGLLNAFTTRHLDRNFIVLFSDILEACGPASPELKYILGHEIGHIRRNHILKGMLLLPGRILPLIGNAYQRACESSCDRYGAFAAGDAAGAITAMMMLSGGREYGRRMSPQEFASQYATERGFFVSWHELISEYPTLSHRVSNLLALGAGNEPARAPRHPLAYLFGLFTLSGPGSGGGSILLTLLVIFALLLVPAIQKAAKAKQQNPFELLAKAQQDQLAKIEKEGELDPRFIGKWNGSAPGTKPDDPDAMTWVTQRNADGTIVIDYTERSHGKVEKSTQKGRWRVVRGKTYYELLEDGDNQSYPVISVAPDKIEFYEIEGDEETRFTETRIPPESP